MIDFFAEMQKYEANKDSCVKWIGEIPSHWSLIRVKQITTKIGSGITPAGGGTSYLDAGIPLLRSQNIHFGKIDLSEVAYISIETHNLMSNSKVQRGDILLNITGASIGRCHYVDKDLELNVNQHVCIVRPKKEVYYVFLNFLLASEVGQGQIWFFQQGGGREGLNFQAIKNFLIPLPPFEEQTAIATFLDRKTAQIDRAITIKEKQIALLRERKQILIQNAVTRGLDPDIPLRDSGVEWIGEIPGHWEVRKFKFLFWQSHLPANRSDGVVTSYRDGQVTLRSNRRMDGYTEAILEQGYQGIRKGQLVLNSMDAFEGAIGVSDSDGKCTPEYVICNPTSDNIFPEYFAFLLREMALSGYIRVVCNAVRQRAVRIRFNNLAKRFMVVPPIKEQTAIVAHIETQSKKIDHAIAIQQQQIEKLKEYKATLINSAVTGKIRVATFNSDKQ